MIRRALAGVALVLLAGSASAAGTYSADFTETRALAGMDQPLVLHGTVRFEPGSLLVWDITAPYTYRFEISGGQIDETLPDGSTRSGALAKTPWANALFDLFSALFSGDANALARYFTVEHTDTGLVLRPRSEVLAKSVARIVVTGTPVPETVAIEDADGTETRLRFSPHGPLPATAQVPAAASR